jgi:hypothetical protein
MTLRVLTQRESPGQLVVEGEVLAGAGPHSTKYAVPLAWDMRHYSYGSHIWGADGGYSGMFAEV